MTVRDREAALVRGLAMAIGLLGEAAEDLATLAEEDERARGLSQRLQLVAEGIEEAWPRSAISETVEWTDPRTGAAVVAHRRDDGKAVG